MAAQLAITRADVTDSEGTVLKGVSVLVRLNKLMLRRGREVLVEQEGITAVVKAGRRAWDITGPDGARWVAVRVGGGCCGSTSP